MSKRHADCLSFSVQENGNRLPLLVQWAPETKAPEQVHAAFHQLPGDPGSGLLAVMSNDLCEEMRSKEIPAAAFERLVGRPLAECKEEARAMQARCDDFSAGMMTP